MSVGKWPIEDIPNADKVFMRVHVNHLDRESIIPGVFRDHNGDMSTDWNKYSTAEETRRRGRKGPEEYGVISLAVEQVRSVSRLTVVHTPLDQNRAHTDVHGEKDTEVRIKLLRSYKWEIKHRTP